MIVDCHIHIHPYPTETNGVGMPKAYGDRNAERMAQIGIPIDRQAEVAVQRMDAAGVDKAIVANPFHAPESGHIRTNLSVHEAIKDYPGRLYALAGIYIRPKPDLAELEYAITKLGFVGMKFLPASQDFSMDDFELLDPLYRKLIELDVPLLIHAGPTFFGGSNPLRCDLRTYYAVIKKYPELKLILAHLGSGALGGLEMAISLANTGPNVYLEASGQMWACTLDHIPPRSSKKPTAWEAFTHDVIFPPGGIRTPEMEEAWQKGKADHTRVVRHVVNRAHGKLMYGTDLPFIARFDFHELYREAIGNDPDLLDEVLGGTASRVFRLG